MRIGDSNSPDGHRWVFAEFALLHDGTANKWRQKIEEDVAKLKRLWWVRSASLMMVAASKNTVLEDWGDYLRAFAVWGQPALSDPFVIELPEGGAAVLKGFDFKCDPAHVLTGTGYRPPIT